MIKTTIFNPKYFQTISYFDLKTLFTGSNVFAGLALVGAGQLVAVFDLPRTNDNFAAIAGMAILDNKYYYRNIRLQIIFFIQNLTNLFSY